MFHAIIGMTCELLTGHRFTAWEPYPLPEAPLARFEQATCRICRSGFVRPALLSQEARP